MKRAHRQRIVSIADHTFSKCGSGNSPTSSWRTLHRHTDTRTHRHKTHTHMDTHTQPCSLSLARSLAVPHTNTHTCRNKGEKRGHSRREYVFWRGQSPFALPCGPNDLLLRPELRGPETGNPTIYRYRPCLPKCLEHQRVQSTVH